MALYKRPTFLTLRDELTLSCGRLGVLEFIPRANDFLMNAYHEIAIMFHHYELDMSDRSLSFSTASNKVALPADLYGIINVALRAPGNGDFVSSLTWEEIHSLRKRYDDNPKQAEVPTEYTRLGNDIYLPRLPDQDYTLDLDYYREVDLSLVDIGGGVSGSELAPLWDRVILDWALIEAKVDIGRPDLAERHTTRVQNFLQNTAQPVIKDVPLFGAPGAPTRAVPHGGAQG